MNITNSQANYDEFFQLIEEEDWWLATQPIVDLRDDNVIANELLLRVKKGDLPLDNSLFFPQITLDHRFLKASFKIWNLINEVIETNKNVFSDKTFINICPQDICNDELVSYIKQVNKKFLYHEMQIVLELSEQFSEKEIFDSKDKFAELVNSGIELALDDYGLGFLNLDLIKQNNIGYLKFDKSICVDSFKENIELIDETLLFCDRNNIISLAEGVESNEQRELLLSKGFKLAQGFFFGKPKKLLNL